MSRQKGILPFFRLSRFGGLMHFSYTMRNYISIALLFLASSVFAYDPPTMGWSSWMPDIDGMVLLKK